MESDEKPARPTRAKMRWSDRPKLAPDAASRQGLATRLALEAFESRDEAIAYLNTACCKLGGRPLDLAVESAEGLSRVERALADLKPAC
ncbi:antitoxin Xre/MbcA/ParS toxin-binding domain-containing protein [Novosphingobium guangzhouense]|uniref:antitoxin Xre/MbcA/ParS toxin-binding domain-containing protein n=1 Tax=Novosphingobium guangzhouense TaxID=1850347 RepID=UPI000CCC526D|nr:antitoxin Xre/MbcA/ParS toxin-binding domain-containing protein [Novosphingobium guangzhouense]